MHNHIHDLKVVATTEKSYLQKRFKLCLRRLFNVGAIPGTDKSVPTILPSIL